ncbi:MAG: site-specific integrase [Thermoguttaceae bacterium]|jgi:integrase
MPRKTLTKRPSRQPSYRRHKARNCAVVTINGKNNYLGPYDSPESHEKYAHLIAVWKANGQDLSALTSPSPNGDITINALILRYLDFASGYYVKNGESTGELNNIRHAAAKLKELFGRTLAKDFLPAALETIQQAMICPKLARTTINNRVSRIKRMFRWASRKGLVPPATYHGLLAVDGLKRGRTAARESKRVSTISEEVVKATLPHLNPHVRSMVQIHELAGMRSQDLCNMRTADIDMSLDVWVYRPWTHKNEHHGQVREIAIGPQAQAVLKPFLKPDAPLAYVFSPKDAVAAVREERARHRKSRRQPSQLARRPKPSPKRAPKDQYDRRVYARAVARACKKADGAHWHPHQLRHNCATKVRHLYGVEGAMAVLGHKIGIVTEIYAERDLQKAIEIMREIG